MLYYDGINLSKGIDAAKSKSSKECIVFYYSFFNNRFGFQNSVCNGCHDLMILCLNISSISDITVKGLDYRSIIHEIGKSDPIYCLESRVLDNRGYI